MKKHKQRFIEKKDKFVAEALDGNTGSNVLGAIAAALVTAHINPHGSTLEIATGFASVVLLAVYGFYVGRK